VKEGGGEKVKIKNPFKKLVDKIKHRKDKKG